MTVVLLTCSYNNQEFVRIGYYANTDYIDPELFVHVIPVRIELSVKYNVLFRLFLFDRFRRHPMIERELNFQAREST